MGEESGVGAVDPLVGAKSHSGNIKLYHLQRERGERVGRGGEGWGKGVLGPGRVRKGRNWTRDGRGEG